MKDSGNSNFECSQAWKFRYLSADESMVQMFFGNTTCPTSPRASELHQKIGHDLNLSARISKLRIARLDDQPTFGKSRPQLLLSVRN